MIESLNFDEFENLKTSLAKRGQIHLSVLTDSMQPLIFAGDQVDVRPVESFKKFDIVVFHNQGKLVCHYISHINQHDNSCYCVTRGLRSQSEDFPLQKNQILGKVTTHKIGFFRKFVLMLRGLA